MLPRKHGSHWMTQISVRSCPSFYFKFFFFNKDRNSLIMQALHRPMWFDDVKPSDLCQVMERYNVIFQTELISCLRKLVDDFFCFRPSIILWTSSCQESCQLSRLKYWDGAPLILFHIIVCSIIQVAYSKHANTVSRNNFTTSVVVNTISCHLTSW